jgi:hypothetical protein
LNTSAGRAH